MVVHNLSCYEAYDMKRNTTSIMNGLLDEIEPITDEIRSLKVKLASSNCNQMTIWEKIKTLRQKESDLIKEWMKEATENNQEWCKHYNINEVGYW
jgi:hypothetical protein